VEEDRELTDEELEQVVGGRTYKSFVVWAQNTLLLHRKDKNDKQFDEKPTRTRND